MKKNQAKILFAASECAPYAKVGGLADVVASLPKALIDYGQNIGIVLPRYEGINLKKYQFKLISVFNFKKEKVKVFQGKLEKTNIPVFLLENDKFLSRGEIYPSKNFENGFFSIKRFLFFSQLVLELVFRGIFEPDIIHCHDWQTAFIAPLLKIKFRDFLKKSPNLAKKTKIKTILTIHNLPYQGEWNPEAVFNFLGFKGDELDTFQIRDKSGDFNILQQGILNADIITTVSPNYAKEILSKEFGEELYEDLRRRKKDLYGILNGIDTELYNPKTDKNLKVNYSAKDFQKKNINKLELQRILGLPENLEAPLFGFIGRLTGQKGIDLIIDSLPELIKLNCQIVILGAGEKDYEQKIIRILKIAPQNISINIKFDSVLAQKIYGGADFILIPSRFEPCGLVQMIAQRYGTVPIARATGGIVDSVEDKVSGFLFKEFKKDEFLKAIKEGLSFYFQKRKWLKIVKNAMKKDFSWKKSAKKYLKIYHKLLN